MAAEVENMKGRVCGFVRVGPYTVAWKPTGDPSLASEPRRARGVIHLATALRNPGDREDPLEGAVAAGRRLFDGAAVAVKVPKGRSVRRYVRKMLSV